MFLNTLTAEYKYSRRNMQTFTQQVQTPFSLKKKFFLNFLLRFWNPHEMENIFKKKRESSSLSISKIIDSIRGGYLSVWKALLQNGFR